MRSKTLQLYKTIVFSILDNGRLPKLNISKQRRHYHVNELKKLKIIKKITRATWEADKEKFDRLYVMKFKPRDIRGHGFQFTLHLPYIINWKNRSDYLKKHNIQYTTSKRNIRDHRIIIDNHKIWLYDNSIVIYFPKELNFYATTAYKSKENVMEYTYNLIRKLESILNYKFKINNIYRLSCDKQHYARIKDEIATLANKEKKKIKCYWKGKQWFQIDDSYNLKEAETMHKDSAPDDMEDIWKAGIEDWKKYPDLTRGKVNEYLTQLSYSMMMFFKYQEFFAKNYEKHTEAIDNLSKYAKKLLNFNLIDLIINLFRRN